MPCNSSSREAAYPLAHFNANKTILGCLVVWVVVLDDILWEARKIDYGVREKSSRLKRKADCLAMRGKQAPEEWSGTGRTRHSPLWVGRWWAPGAEVPPPKREEQITNLVDRGQEYSLVTSRLHRFRAELAEKGGEETETGSSSLLWSLSA